MSTFVWICVLIEIMCLTSIQDTSFLNRIGSRISARSFEQKQRGVNRSNLITISPILPVLSNHDVNVLRSDSMTDPNRKASQNHANLKYVETSKTDSKFLKFCLFNAQSVKNKFESINDFIFGEKADICAVTETWLSEDDTQICNSICPEGFEIFQKSRTSDRKGGGVAVILKQSFKAKVTSSNNEYVSFEHMIISMKIGGKDTDLAVLYRPPHLSKKLFLEEFEHLITENFKSQKRQIICGDFNVNCLDKTDF